MICLILLTIFVIENSECKITSEIDVEDSNEINDISTYDVVKLKFNSLAVIYSITLWVILGILTKISRKIIIVISILFDT